MNNENIESVRKGALNAIDKSEKNFKWLIAIIALLEGVLIISLVYNMDWSNKTHIVIFLATMLVYGVLGMGMVALGAFTRLNTLKVIKAIDVASK